MTNQSPNPDAANWALLRPDGCLRATTTASNRAEAEKKLRTIIRKGTLPSGWKAVPLITVPAPHTFKVGDRVHGKTGLTGPVMEGVVFKIDGAGDVHFTVEDEPTRRWGKPENLVLVEPAPSPRPFMVGDRVEWIYTGPTSFSKKLEIGDHGAVVQLDGNGWPIVDWDGPDAIKTHFFSGGNPHKYLRLVAPKPEEILAAVRRATGISASDEPDLAKAVRSIASQMDRHRQERDEARTREQIALNMKNAVSAEEQRQRERANAAEAKLADTRAILRVERLGLLTDTTLEAALAKVLDLG